MNDTDLASGKLNRGLVDLDQVVQNIQTAIEWWEGCLKFTRGSIRPDKTFAYIIDFHFKANGEYEFKDPYTLAIDLEVRDEQNILQLLQIVNPDMGKETLGVYITLNGNMRD